MSTLAEQFHDSFDAYYAGKKTGWCDKKVPAALQAAKQPPHAEQKQEPQTAEPRH